MLRTLLLCYTVCASVSLVDAYETAKDTIPENIELHEVVISTKSHMHRLNELSPSVVRLDVSELAKMPSLFGERDIIKSMQLLPGIKSESDASSGYEVRGGTAAQNLILLDDATVYNAGHLMGISSAFNDDAISNASIFKGIMPSRYGDAVSSVLSVQSTTGDMEDYSFAGTVGLLSAKAMISGPIVKDKVSMFVSARRTYLDMFLKLSDDYKDNTLYFYDVNAKFSWNLNDNDMMSLSFFRGRDNLGLADLMDMGWGNTDLSLKLYHRFNRDLRSNTSLIFSEYQSNMAIDVLSTSYAMSGFIRHLGLNEAIDWCVADNIDVSAGWKSTYITLKSAEWYISALHEREQRRAWENGLWVEGSMLATTNLNLSAGVRLSLFSALGGSPYYDIDAGGNIVNTYNYSSSKIVKTWAIAEPRISAHWRINDYQSINIGLSRSAQYIQAIRTSSTSMPFDRYTMASNIINPEIANQVAAGYVGMFKDGKYELDIETYLKGVENIYDYRDGKSLNSEIQMERLLLGGKGRAFGVEFTLRKNTGRLSGWLAYTLSWSENKIDGINSNQWYPSANDRRHDITIVGVFQLSKHWEVTADWLFNTGAALTLPSAKYQMNGETYYYYAERNGYRAPAYHRLDVSFTNTRKHRNYETQWDFGVYNLYGHYNPFIITVENDDTRPSGTKTIQRSLFGFLPSVSFTVKF